MRTSTAFGCNDLGPALCRYEVMAHKQTQKRLPAVAWRTLRHRIMAALKRRPDIQGDRRQAIVDRANDCDRYAESSAVYTAWASRN